MSRHLMAHLFIPLLVGLGVELAVVYYHGNFPGWYEFAKEKLVLVGGIILTYVLLSTYLIYKETKVQVEMSQLRDLENALPAARNFFATCALSLKEWFDPSTQVYFAKILGRQISGGGPFNHQRVLLFFHSSEIKDSQSPFLDGHYALAMAGIHENFGIDLAFLRRRDIYEILSGLSVEEKKTIKCYPRWLGWAPDRVLELYLRCRRRIPELDFAFITRENAAPIVFPFSKRGESLKIEKPGSIQTYEKLMGLIKDMIYEPGTNPPRLRARHDFPSKVKTF